MAVSARLSARDGRKFAFQVGGAFALLGALSAWRGHEWPPRVLWTVGGALLLAGTLLPSRLTRVHRAWMSFGNSIAKVTAPLVAGALYFLILTPAGIVLRLLGKNPLRPQEREGGFWGPTTPGGRSNLDTQY